MGSIVGRASASDYVGTTSQTPRVLAFVVDGSTIPYFAAEVLYHCGGGTEAKGGSILVEKSIPIDGTGAFYVRNLDVTLSGTIDESGTASGVLNALTIIGGGQICSSSNVTWNATLISEPPPTIVPPTTESRTTTTVPPTTEPTRTPVVTVSSAIVQPGSTMSARGWGLHPGESVTATQFSTPRVLGRNVADANGQVSFTWTLHEDVALGQHEVVLNGSTSGSASAPFQVAENLQLPQTH